MQYIFILVILSSITRSNADEDEIDLIDELCHGGGTWILAAAGGNAEDAPPPSKTCVKIYITDMETTSDCIFNTYNHDIRAARILRIVGIDEDNNTEIYTMGPFHQWLDTTLATPGTDAISFNAMAKSSICWNRNSFKFKSYTFTATAIAQDPFLSKRVKQSHFIYLVGVNCRMRSSEIHSALLTKQKPPHWEVENMIQKLERMFEKEFPPLHVKCSNIYPHDPNRPIRGYFGG